MSYHEDDLRKIAEDMADEPKPVRPIIFEDPGPAADKHSSTPDGAAAYDRQRSAREGDQS